MRTLFRLVLIALAFAVLAPAPGHAAAAKAPKRPAESKGDSKGGDSGPIGHGGAKVQLSPMMSPYRTPSGVRYQVITVRLILDAGVNERPACFMAPVVHEKILLYFNKTQPLPEDFAGQRKEVMEKNLLDVAIQTTDRGFYSGIEIVDENSHALGDDDAKSKTLTAQCK